ncbi:uncharacterized protein METZ01_LOCUS139429 [marine metagenome]|uniref:Uncharacterized protein n=1 Tax=marine metagenome TaxID=408172 RepID=A0A381ZB92_9ZZZZ
MLMHRPAVSKYGVIFRQRYEEVGLPCRNTIGSPEPFSI